ncbi:MucR family transcriptional regulator [Methylorubrum extorquens]|uniref:MucR family transcriptional regulator n=1 Tax=Methylorubrum extorquens TaxID=408 RepID=UPI0009D6C403
MSRQPNRRSRRNVEDVRYVGITGSTDVFMIWIPPGSNVRKWKRIRAEEVPEGAVVIGSAALEMTALNVSNIVSSFVANNPLAPQQLPTLISEVHSSLCELDMLAESSKNLFVKLTPGQIQNSITPGALISFINGKPYKTLRRHLAVQGLTPDDYRARYGLPADYPMTCADYSAKRSELARRLGLGHGTRRASKGSVPRSAKLERALNASSKRAGRKRKSNTAGNNG